MAAVMENTIPCERCGTQIYYEDWSAHLTKCATSTKKPTERKSDEPVVEGIPCEFCHVSIDLKDWQSHTKQCEDLHKREINKLKHGFGDEITTTMIPCEYCDQSIDLHKYEWHTKLCINNKRQNTNTTIDSELIGTMIPCEYCGKQVIIVDYQTHTEECADSERQRADEIIKRTGNDPNIALIPCQYCNKPFALSLINDHQTECQNQMYAANNPTNLPTNFIVGGTSAFPDTWTWNVEAMNNLSVHLLPVDSEEYKFVSGKFQETLPTNPIIKIERIQNKRWYRQFEAHRDDFVERHGKSTEQWLFHGCKSQSTDAIMRDCFNRSHAIRCAAGQGIYFATQASTSLAYTQPDSSNHRHMFMARVLVGKTAPGNQTTRVCPAGFDTTGGLSMFVTYHDAQAYGEYLITFQ